MLAKLLRTISVGVVLGAVVAGSAVAAPEVAAPGGPVVATPTPTPSAAKVEKTDRVASSGHKHHKSKTKHARKAKHAKKSRHHRASAAAPAAKPE